VNNKITKYIEKISRRHSIPLRLLLEDLTTPDNEPETPEKGNQCLGVVKGGKRCKRTGKQGGYCWFHADQKKIKQAAVCPPCPSVPQVKHTHSLPPLFLAGCPACERNNQPQNLLIDM
jgi:hypothetical protein